MTNQVAYSPWTARKGATSHNWVGSSSPPVVGSCFEYMQLALRSICKYGTALGHLTALPITKHMCAEYIKKKKTIDESLGSGCTPTPGSLPKPVTSGAMVWCSMAFGNSSGWTSESPCNKPCVLRIRFCLRAFFRTVDWETMFFKTRTFEFGTFKSHAVLATVPAPRTTSLAVKRAGVQRRDAISSFVLFACVCVILRDLLKRQRAGCKLE